jgi:hypothetical protein
MRLRVGFFVTLMIVALAVGCAPQGKQDGYAVLFDGMVNIYDDAIYLNSSEVGAVLSTEAGGGGVTKITVTLSPELVAQSGDNLALYAHAGRLEVATLQRMGQALEKGAPLCGFTSKSQLNWFKVKTLLNDRVNAAKKRAASLLAKFG